jgi:exosortase H (IPTLxxWG-CTERM-specific)
MKTEWRSRLLLLRIVAVFGLLVGLFYAVAATEFYQTRIFEPYVVVNADLSGRILTLFGFEMTVGKDTIRSPEYGLGIGKGCDGLEPTALFVAAVLAFAAPIRLKLPALLLGVPLLAALNLVRIVSLFLVGVYYPDLFHMMHVDVWQVLYILVGIVFFGLWLLWATSGRQPTEAPRQTP